MNGDGGRFSAVSCCALRTVSVWLDRWFPRIPDSHWPTWSNIFASLLISDKADIKAVQARLRHASAKTTLDTYGHLWPDAQEYTPTTPGGFVAAGMETSADVNSAG